MDAAEITQTKHCARCGEDKPRSEFHRNRAKRDGLTGYCKLCRNKNPNYRPLTDDERKQRRREAVRRWKDRNPEKHAAHMKAHYEANREVQIERAKQWQKDNPDRVRERNSQYRAKKRTTQVEAVSFDAILEEYGATCHICQQPIDLTLTWPERMSLSFDHVIPLAGGGTHTADNIKPSHLTCNISKGAKVA